MSTSRRVSRRQVLVGLGAGAAALATAPFVDPRPEPPPSPSRRTEILVELLRHELSFLTHDEAGLRAFADEWVRRNNRVSRAAIQTYLLSTDFFQNGEDERRPLRYLVFYDPQTTPCYNPLADLRDA